MNRILLILVISVSILACSEADHFEQAPAFKDMSTTSTVQESELLIDMSEEQDILRTQEPSPPKTDARKLIRNGSMHCEVNSLDSARGQLSSILNAHDGYVSSENASSRYRDDLTYSLRIPEAKFDSFILAVEGISKEVLSRNISVNDVTDQYVDIAARLSTKRALHQRYTELLSRAKNVKEVIEVERELAKVLAEIESSEARMKSLGDRASYATLNLSFSIEKEPLTQATFFSDFGDSLSAGWTGVKMAVLLGATLWPLLLFGLALFFGIRWVLNKRTARQKLKLD